MEEQIYGRGPSVIKEGSVPPTQLADQPPPMGMGKIDGVDLVERGVLDAGHRRAA